MVLQIRRRRRGQQLINNPGDRLIAVPRTSSTRYPCTTPVPVYLVPCTLYPVPRVPLTLCPVQYTPCTSPCTPMYPATHDGSRYSSHWILTLSSLHSLVSAFALLKASVNSRDTPVNNYPPVYFCVLGGRENFENTQLEAVKKAKYNNICHSWKILPITFHLIQFLGGKFFLF